MDGVLPGQLPPAPELKLPLNRADRPAVGAMHRWEFYVGVKNRRPGTHETNGAHCLPFWDLAICPLEGYETTLCCSGRDLMVCPEGFLCNRGKLWVKELSMKT